MREKASFWNKSNFDACTPILQRIPKDLETPSHQKKCWAYVKNSKTHTFDPSFWASSKQTKSYRGWLKRQTTAKILAESPASVRLVTGSYITGPGAFLQAILCQPPVWIEKVVVAPVIHKSWAKSFWFWFAQIYILFWFLILVLFSTT